MIEVVECGPLCTVQDEGREGYLSQGLSRGGVADRRAHEEARALLGGACGAGIETAGAPLTLRFRTRSTVALVGASMSPGPWHRTREMAEGSVLRLVPEREGTYSYVYPAGGLGIPTVLGSRATHLIAGIGGALRPGMAVSSGGETGPARRTHGRRPRRLSVEPDRFGGGILRCVETPQSSFFPEEILTRFADTPFRRDPRGNRQGVRLAFRGPGFAPHDGLSILSDFVLPGDVQVTGDGTPYILGPECQTTGGYPRIAQVIAADLPKAMQAPPGAALTFVFVTVEAARAARPGRPSVVEEEK